VQHAGRVEVSKRFPAVGEDDDRKVAADRGNLLTNRSAIDVGEHEIEDHRIEEVAIENRQRLDAVSCFHGVIPVQRQRDGKQPPEIVVDFDEEDGASGFRHLPATSADACACGVATPGRGGSAHQPSTAAWRGRAGGPDRYSVGRLGSPRRGALAAH